MKRQQLILVSSAVLFVAILFIFGRTVPPGKAATPGGSSVHTTTRFDFAHSLNDAKAKLSPDRQAYVGRLESAVVRGDVKDQQLHVFHQLAAFWKDSASIFEPYAFYTAEAAKLENSEKSLTFAAQLFLDNLRGTADPALKGWMADQAKDLFQRSLKLNPLNDSAKIGLGSCYIFASSAGEDPQQVMQGIQHILEVARRDPENMYAQLMLGIGGLVSGQVDKAIERLLTVVSNEPSNIEAILTLAEAYERKGDKGNAIRWYQESKRHITNPEVTREIDNRIQDLNKN